MRLRKTFMVAVCVAVAFTILFTLSPVWAAEFAYDKGPVFSVTYPDGWKASDDNPDNVLLVTKMNGSLPIMNVDAASIPEGVPLKDWNATSYKEALEKSQETEAEVKENEAITLPCGTPANMSLISWSYQGFMPLLTRVVSAYKDGKAVSVSVHSAGDDNPEVPQSLKFK